VHFVAEHYWDNKDKYSVDIVSKRITKFMNFYIKMFWRKYDRPG